MFFTYLKAASKKSTPDDLIIYFYQDRILTHSRDNEDDIEDRRWLVLPDNS